MTAEPVSVPVAGAPATAQRRPPLRAVATETSAPALSSVALATVLMGVLLPMVDFFIVNVALPTMAVDLHASTALLELVVAGYATAYAVLLVIGGRLGDTIGRRRMFVLGMMAFTVASLLCGLAPTAATLVGGRVLQGAAAAAMVPQTLSTIQATGDMSSRSRALAWFGAAGGSAAVLGQVLGGVLVSANLFGWGWRPIFLVNVPLGIAGVWLALRHVPETRAVRATRIDVSGTLLLAAAVVGVLVPLTEGRALGWPVWSWLLAASVPVSVAAFVSVERRLERRGLAAMVPPSLLRHRSMRVGLALGAPFFAGFGAFMFVYALVAQGSLGFSAVEAGLALAPMGGAFLLASLQTPRLVPRFGRRVITVGALLELVGVITLGATLLAGWPHVAAVSLAPGLAVMGAGLGLVMPAVMRVVLSDVPIADAGAGSGVMATTQQVSLAVGVATLGTLFITLAPVTRLGMLHAVLVVLAIEATTAAYIALGSRRLPLAA